jgi:hypothetical protein
MSAARVERRSGGRPHLQRCALGGDTRPILALGDQRRARGARGHADRRQRGDARGGAIGTRRELAALAGSGLRSRVGCGMMPRLLGTLSAYPIRGEKGDIMRAFLFLALLLFSGPALAQEKLIGSNVDLRTSLAFKASDAAVQKMLPDGWEVSSLAAGPSKGANLLIVLVDQLVSHDGDGKPAAPFRGATLVALAKKKGTDTTGPMVFGGLYEPTNIPGAYGVFTMAESAVERKTHTGVDKKLTKGEHWQFKAANGTSLEVQIQFASGAPTISKLDTKVFSAAKPDFFRIYRGEQAIDVARSTATGVDRVTKVSLKASGDKLGLLFDGTEQLISVVSVPWYSRQLYLPGS